MEISDAREYETLDVESSPQPDFGFETSAGGVKHNGAMGLYAGKLQSGQATTTEPAIWQTIY